MHDAVNTMDQNVVEQLGRQMLPGPGHYFLQDKWGQNPLHVAIDKNLLSIVDRLLSYTWLDNKFVKQLDDKYMIPADYCWTTNMRILF